MSMKRRARNHRETSQRLLSFLKDRKTAANGASRPQTEQREAEKLLDGLKRIINHRRKRDSRPQVTDKELAKALESYLAGNTNDPAVEELTDALSNLREADLGFDKFGRFPLLK